MGLDHVPHTDRLDSLMGMAEPLQARREVVDTLVRTMIVYCKSKCPTAEPAKECGAQAMVQLRMMSGASCVLKTPADPPPTLMSTPSEAERQVHTVQVQPGNRTVELANGLTGHTHTSEEMASGLP